MNNPNPITEADMLAYLRDVAAKYAPQFPEFTELVAGASAQAGAVYLAGYTHGISVSKIGNGVTFEAAAANLRKQVGPREVTAAKLRKEAAKLIAEADKLESTKSP